MNAATRDLVQWAKDLVYSFSTLLILTMPVVVMLRHIIIASYCSNYDSLSFFKGRRQL